jgi:hypothetical protein
VVLSVIVPWVVIAVSEVVRSPGWINRRTEEAPMSTLVLAMALWAAPGNVPEGISPDAEQPLRMSGKWVGPLKKDGSRSCWEVSRRGPALYLTLLEGNDLRTECTLVDEGSGRLRLEIPGATFLGIYRWEGDRVVMCFGVPCKGRPTFFHDADDQSVITLRRVR